MNSEIMKFGIDKDVTMYGIKKNYEAMKDCSFLMKM